jgi:uncharacterized membrane protein
LGIALTLILVGLTVSSILPPILLGMLVFPFVLILPGNALICAIFPESRLPRLERFLYVIGLSLAVIILSGLLLNITSWGLQTNSWLFILSVVTVGASMIAIRRRSQLSVQESTPVRFSLQVRQLIFLGLAIVMIGFALKLTLTPQPPANIQGYTSLWILPESETQPGTLLVGIHSQELQTTQYDLMLTYNHQFIKKWINISLEPGATWQHSITMPSGQGLAEAVLYRTDNPEVIYRQVSTTLNK